VRWIRPADPEQRTELDRWCLAVGPPVVYRPERGVELEEGLARPDLPIEVALVAWNTNVGRGDLLGLIEDLRSGRLTGIPAVHFVLLLQEAFRAGGSVPARADDASRSAERIGSDGDRSGSSDIQRFAREQGLHLFYAPTMRNGPHGPPEDRGNAILSTLPLSDFQVVEFPVRKQRRIATAATIEIPGAVRAGTHTVEDEPFGSGTTWKLRVVNVHLDHISSWRRFHRSLGADREDDAELLVSTFGGESQIVVGGDFNSWFGGNGEPAIRLMREHFPDPLDRPTEATLETPFFPFSRLLDHLFFRLPAGWDGDYMVAPSLYGSDHRPLVGWVRPQEEETARSSGDAAQSRDGR